jgi:hypothetical protein
VNWNVTPAEAFASATPRNLYLGATDNSGASTGLVQKGTWTIQGANVAPMLGTITPSAATSSAGTAQPFAAIYSDGNGYTDLSTVQLYVGGGALYISAQYSRTANKIYLRDDAGTSWGSGCTPATAGTLTNSQGAINCLATTVNGSGNNLTVNWNVTPAAAFASATPRNLYLGATDNSGASTGLVLKGTWTITQ